MTSKLPIFVTAMMILLTVTSRALDHARVSPGMASRNGGQVASSEEVGAHFEVVHIKNKYKIYIFPMDLSTDPGRFVLKASIQKNGKKESHEFHTTPKSGFHEFESSEKKGFKLFLKVTNTVTKKQDLLRFVF